MGNRYFILMTPRQRACEIESAGAQVKVRENTAGNETQTRLLVRVIEAGG